jgi:branched-chain amino acid transport system substrate-binding protein
MILGRAAKMANGADMDTHIAMVGTDYAAASATTLTFDSHGDVAPTNGYSVCQFDALSSTDVYFNCMKYWDQSAGITAETFTGLTVKIGLLAGTTGPLAVYGSGFIAAANIALGVMNIAGFGNGVQFELVIADPACGVGDAGTTGAQALADAGVWGVVGAACSGATAQALAVLDPLGIPMISYASTNPALSNATNFFRTVPSDASQGPAIAAAVAADGYSNPALLHMTNDYGAGLAGATSAAWEALDSNSDGTNNALCTTIGYAESTTDFTSQITAIDSAGCDSIILVSYATDGAAIIEEMAAQSLSIGVFGGDGIAKTGIGTGMADNSTLEGIVATLPAAGPANERSAAFAVLCGSVSACDAGIYTAETFDAMLIMGYSIFASLSSPGVPKAAMIAAVGVGFVGASGVHTFGYDGNAPDIDPINGYCVVTFHVDTTGTTNVVTFDCERSFTEADGVATETSS